MQLLKKVGSTQAKMKPSIKFPAIIIWNIVFWRVLFSKILGNMLAGNAILIIKILVVVCFAISIWKIYRKEIVLSSFQDVVIVVLFALYLFLVSLLRNNTIINNYFQNFLSYVFLPAILMTSINETDEINCFIKVYIVFSVITFITLGFTPVLRLNLFADYMDFGFNVILPSGIGLIIFRERYKKLYLFPLEAICYFIALVYANRSTFLTLVLCAIISNAFLAKLSIRKLAVYVLLIICVVLVYENINGIIEKIISLVEKMGYYSSSLRKATIYLSGQHEGWDSGRSQLAGAAIREISENIFGMGICQFEIKYNNYPHNILLEFGTSWGLPGLILFIALVAVSFKSFIAQKSNEVKQMFLLLFFLWFPKLFYSATFIIDIGFWSFLVFASMKNKRHLIRIRVGQ